MDPTERIRLELVTRKFMVILLGLTAAWVGLAIMVTGAPSFIEDWFSPWSRFYVGGVAEAAGLTVVLGGMVGDLRRSGWWTQVTGLALLVLWYAGLGASYAVLVFQQGVDIVGPGEHLPSTESGRAYVPMVYLGLMLMTATPLVTMLRIGRPTK
jgi:hypothetical protein